MGAAVHEAGLMRFGGIVEGRVALETESHGAAEHSYSADKPAALRSIRGVNGHKVDHLTNAIGREKRLTRMLVSGQ